ncbi:MAG: hypothetical protein HY268_19400, partial [Deltaproteobacteria bacterium]|nr:hypothetical protein [Deltaproteobacteria bacterium]
MERFTEETLQSILNTAVSESRKKLRAESLAWLLKLSFFVLVSVCVLQGWNTSANAVPVCGDGVLDAGEQCDLGGGLSGNGTAGTCCTGSCTFKPISVCRPSAGVCDAAESCTGGNANCPADAFAAAGTGCPDDGNVCTLDQCDGANTCQHTANAILAGTSCPSDSNPCTLDQCDGTNTACQHTANAILAGTSCPSDSNPCTLDQCDGTNTACQHTANAILAGTSCPSDSNPCTLDQCDGTNTACQHPAG